MKRFTVLTALLSLSALAVRVVFQVAPAPKSASAAKYDNAPIPIYDATGAMLQAISSKGPEVKFAPVYDAMGAMLQTITPEEVKANTVWSPVYDATGVMLDILNP